MSDDVRAGKPVLKRYNWLTETAGLSSVSSCLMICLCPEETDALMFINKGHSSCLSGISPALVFISLYLISFTLLCFSMLFCLTYLLLFPPLSSPFLTPVSIYSLPPFLSPPLHFSFFPLPFLSFPLFLLTSPLSSLLSL